MAASNGNSGKRRDYTRSIGFVMGERLTQMGIAAKIREHTAPLVWAELVGPQVAAATEVDKVSAGTLYVSTKSAMWAQELNFHKADILRRLNEKLGGRNAEPVITDIRFASRGLRNKQAAPEKPPALNPTRAELEDVSLSANDLESVEREIAVARDESLRDRLRRAGLANARLRLWRMENGWSPCPKCTDLAPPTFPYDGTVTCAHCQVARHLGR